MRPKGSIDTQRSCFREGPLQDEPGPRAIIPPDSTLADLKHLHKTLGVDAWCSPQPSTYGPTIPPFSRRHGGAQRGDAQSRALRRLRSHEHQGRRTGRARCARRARSAGSTPTTRAACRSSSIRSRTRGSHPSAGLSFSSCCSRQDILGPDAVFRKLTVPMSIGPLCVSAGDCGHPCSRFQRCSA